MMSPARQSLARRVAVTAFLVVVTGAASACVFDLDPQVNCQSVEADDCDRAVEMARPLLAAYWHEATEVLVHAGLCSRVMQCSQRQANHPDYLTVELVSERPENASVVIDRSAEWTATCRLIVPDATGAHAEACADE
jgi:hypothetical protein